MPFLRLDRTGVAVVGATLMVVTGGIGFDAAVRAVDFHTIVLLFSMMIIVAHLRLAGGLAAAGQWAAHAVTRPAALLVLLVFASGVLSALFVNDTICLVFTPLVLDVVGERRLRPLPFVIVGIGLVTIGFFASHSVASSWVGLRAREGKAQASALYLFFYYMGASTAGTIGGFFWTAYAWPGVAVFLVAMLLVAFALARRALWRDAPEPHRR